MDGIKQALSNCVDIMQHRIKRAAIHQIRCQPFYGDYIGICGSGLKVRRPRDHKFNWRFK